MSTTPLRPDSPLLQPIIAGALKAANRIWMAYLHVLAEVDDSIVAKLKSLWPNMFVLNTGFGADSGRDELERIVADGLADAVTVGRAFLANPDLVERWTLGAELNAPDYDTFYSGGAKGYTDYPRLAG